MIDPSAFIAPGAIVLGDVHLGVESSVWYNAVLRGDKDRITIGDRTNIQDLTMIHADPGVPSTFGNRVTVGHRVILHGCTIEDDCLIGMGAIILNRVRVGRGSIIAPARFCWKGWRSPGLARRRPAGQGLRPVDGAAAKHLEHGWRHYIEQARRHRDGAFPTQPHTGRGEGSVPPSADESSRDTRISRPAEPARGPGHRSLELGVARDDASPAPSPSRRTPRSPRRRTRPDLWRHRVEDRIPSHGAIAPSLSYSSSMTTLHDR